MQELKPTLSPLCFVDALTMGKSVTVLGTDFVPILGPPMGPELVLLEEAMQLGLCKVMEIDNRGNVNEIEIEYTGDALLLLIGGEEILGAKQNRIFNASFVMRRGSARLPVSCVERDRWGGQSRNFAASGRTAVSSVRNTTVQRVTQSVVSERSFESDQREIWSEVDGYLARSQVASGSAAMADGMRSTSKAVDREIAKLVPLEGQVGIAACRNGELVSLDLFATPDLYCRAQAKAIRGILGDSYRPSNGSDPQFAVNRALAELRRAEPRQLVAPGGGMATIATGTNVILSAIQNEEGLCHAVVVPKSC